MTNNIELLAPAKDEATAIAAIRTGADAVYIGAARFGAREGAGNSIEAIHKVVDFAHQYYAKVYTTLNTLLFDNELPAAEKLIEQLYKVGIDGLIIQDVGLLELDLPPVPLIASTQMNNNDVEKVKFLQDVGFSRVILARELTLDEIHKIKKQTTIELECFIHGALCVAESGQCYMSYAIGGRSGNRGQCAQPCRRVYTLKDDRGNVIIKNKHLLSLKDLNLSAYIGDLIDAGITAFKIEGRLKDLAYVVNTVGFYRRLLDEILLKKGYQKSSSGRVKLNFEPNPERTFNRGFTDYGITGTAVKMLSPDTPKSTGEFLGLVKEVGVNYFFIDGNKPVHSGDGLCFFDKQRNLRGTVVNGVEESKVLVQKIKGIYKGQEIYRNFDCEFERKLKDRAAERKIDLAIVVRETTEGLLIVGKDEDGNEAAVKIENSRVSAEKEDVVRRVFINQFTKLGNTIFSCSQVKLEIKKAYFFPVSKLNQARRELVKRLLEVRQINRPQKKGGVLKNNIPYPETHLSYTGNVLNTQAKAFYRRHGVKKIEPGAESGIDMTGKTLMKTKMCLRREINLCRLNASSTKCQHLILIDEHNRQFQLNFKCGHCGMEVVLSATSAFHKPS